MNLKYAELTAHDYPKQLGERIKASKEGGTSACCTFNRRGTLLGIGCREGHINIWDFETRSISKQLRGHTGIVTSISWSRNGNKLLSSDWNGLLLLWDIITSNVLIKIEFENRPIEHSWLHGRSSKLAIIHLHESQPLIITFNKRDNNNNTNVNSNNETQQIITINNDNNKPIKIINHSYNLYSIETKLIQLSDFITINPKNLNKKSKKSIKKQPRITCGVFDKFAKHIYCGTSNGRLLIINWSEWKIICNDKITNSQQKIKSIVFSRCGNYIVLNCGDRIIRYIEIIQSNKQSIHPKIEIKKQYQDAVERKNWNACCFSSNGEYICAASQNQECIIYIWQRCYERSLEKVLKCDEIGVVVDMIWHPIQPILVSVSQCGEIQIWNQQQMENGHNWSTFDANFKVLTKNIWAPEMNNEKMNKNKNNNSGNNDGNNNDKNNNNDGNNNKINEQEWLKQQLSLIENNECDKEMNKIDILKEDGNFDRFSADEFEIDLLDPINDSLKNELIHLPIQINCPYKSNQIIQYLNNIKIVTNKYMTHIYNNNNNNNKLIEEKKEINNIQKDNNNNNNIIKQIQIKPSIKISNKNEKVLQNLTKHLHSSHHQHHHLHHVHHLNVKKMRKKKNKQNKHTKINKGNINNNQIIHSTYAINPFKSFNNTNNNYNTLKMNASNVQKRSLSNINNVNLANNTNVITHTNRPPKKKQKLSH